MTEQPKTLVELSGVAKVYGGVEVLHAIDLALRDGEFMTVLGPSGSGKTTVLRLIGGLVQPTRGKVLLDGRDISAMPINRRPFNTVFQDYALFPHMTVEANVGYGLKVRGESRARIRDRVIETLRLVALEEFAGRYPSQLSGGQQQRVALARAIICEPRLILLDEPLGALDAELRRQMQRFLKNLQREIRTTFLFVTHDQEEAVTMADRICVMNHGRIEQIGSPEEVYYRPVNEYVARFFGDNNLIDVALGEAGEEDRELVSDVGSFRCRLEGRSAVGAATRDSPGKLLVRPEAVVIGEAANGMRNRMKVRVEETGFVGPVSQVTVSAAAKPELRIMVKLPSRAGGIPLAVGDETEIGWSDRECHVVTA
ncbi:MAG: ABC transporter ATP-binding protein [Bauldia sp.]|nr:ABC transporter ATP-binding protein [Bauldia sp.]